MFQPDINRLMSHTNIEPVQIVGEYDIAGIHKIEKTAIKTITVFMCGPTWARTRDHLIMSQVL